MKFLKAIQLAIIFLSLSAGAQPIVDCTAQFEEEVLKALEPITIEKDRHTIYPFQKFEEWSKPGEFDYWWGGAHETRPGPASPLRFYRAVVLTKPGTCEIISLKVEK